MSKEGVESGEFPENHAEDVMKQEQEELNMDNVIDRNLVKENGFGDGNPHSNYNHDELLQMVVELKFQNEYMKSQYDGLKNHLLDSDQPEQRKVQDHDDSGFQDDVRELRREMETLKKELLGERQTRGAAEEALKHLRSAHLDADTKAQELSAKLAEAQQKMDQEIKERDEKYSELDSKFNRLHKRAKQRIQEVQKEKDDLEAQFREVNEKADLASSQLSALQQELERTRQHANEALKAMDAERQQLRSANNKLRDNIEELRHSLAPKENALEATQQLLLEKEQMLEDMRGLLQVADEKRQASIAELSLKHQKQVENIEAQIADALAERSRATETISSLRALIVEKDTKIAEMDAASSGEAARLRAAIETLKGELSHLKSEHEKEKEGLEATLQSMRSKLEVSESNRIHAEVEAAKLRSQLESELSVQTQLLNNKDAELEEAKEKINRIEGEFASYKVRAHALLQKKDAELAAARDNDQLKALEEALKDAEREILLVSAEKDKALQEVKDVLTNSEKELSTRDAALSMAEQQIKSLQVRLDSAFATHQSEKEAWDRNLQNIEETWRLRCELLERQNEEFSGQNLEREVEELKLQCKKLKEEHNSFRDLADKMMEEKDKEISRLLDDNKNLHQLLDSRPSAEYPDEQTALQKQEASNSSSSAAEQQILILARQQAQREEELAQTQRHILALQEEIEELEYENRLHSQQEAMLKEELRNMERMQKREGVDLTYLKNVILKLLQTGEVERLLPVIAMLLQFSPDEMQKCQQAYRSSNEVPPSPASDSSGSARSLFSRFSFS
ncbi:E3 ubiquitin ligase involved in syntaxin degradation [Handroanthus impetiginosus]|uniref:E3 ubiquitin ligase involved in syntaxin degradation n=1 Tax=Handroanthus impetiginosus TaxID=429701 RepID=A0A2G9GRB1_9LAMI|nr:E3 ubiquitin ligase involved in syntaxin degradation [Handroanthus impetiginosus]